MTSKVAIVTAAGNGMGGEGRTYQIVAVVGAVLMAAAMLVACLYAKHLIMGEAINRGMMKPANPILAVVCTGIAFAAPAYSAFCIGLLSVSFRSRLTIGIGWFGLVIAAFAIGTRAWPGHDIPQLFNHQMLFAMPLITLGWCIPLFFLRWLKGWRLEFAGSKNESTPDRLTISELMIVTVLASICLACLLNCEQRYQMIGLFGMLFTSVLGTVLVIPIWALLRTRYSIVYYLAIGTIFFFVTYSLMGRFSPGGVATTQAVLLTTFVGALLIGFVLARVGGMRLATGSMFRLSSKSC